MSGETVWLNKSLSSTFDVAEALRASGTFRIVCSSSVPDAPVSRVCDRFEVEPAKTNEADYVEFCLEIVRRHRVDVFIPGRNLRAVVRSRERFEAEGVRLIAAADADTLAIVENKPALYAAVGSDIALLPEYEVVVDLAGFDAAYGRLRERHPRACFKPSVSVFGLGFRIVHEGGSAVDRLMKGDPYSIGLEEARRCLGERPTFRDMMVMQFLSGAERSVDCLARRGTLVRCVVRRKSRVSDGPQLLEDNPDVERMTSRLTERLGLDGLFNVQFRDDRHDVPHLLEINPRMSGGLIYSNLSGLNFPYWAVRLALGASPDEVPRPQTGLRIAKVNRAIRL